MINPKAVTERLVVPELLVYAAMSMLLLKLPPNRSSTLTNGETENVAGPLNRAVHANHTDAPPGSLVPPWDGSPTSFVAPKLLNDVFPKLPSKGREFVRLSLSTTP